MTAAALLPAALRVRIDPGTLGFADTAELEQQPLPWIGQERAEMAARLGLGLDQPGYNLFVLGEIGSGRSSLLHQMMQTVAADRNVPPDLCYIHNFDAPERPRALRLPAGQGRLLRDSMAQMVKDLQLEIPRRLAGPDFKEESEHIQKSYKAEEAQAYAELDAFAEARHFTLYRDSGHLVFTLRGEQGQALTENEALALPKERRTEIDQAEEELRAAITQFIEKMRPLERVMNEGLAALRRQLVKPLLEHALQGIRLSLKKQIKDSVKLGAYLEQVLHDLLNHIELFQPVEEDEARQEALTSLLMRYRVNLLVDNSELHGAPVIVEDNPLLRSLFGSIEYQYEEDMLVSDFSRIRAGSLLKAHGGFLMLHLRDLMSDEVLWEKLRRLLRSGRLQIEESGLALSPVTAVSLLPEAVDVEVKIVLIAATEHYYALQEADPEFARHFRIKVDFAESFAATAEVRHASAIFVAHTCHKMGLPHFSAAAVARLLEQAHREVDDQARQSAIFASIEALVVESASCCRRRGNARVEMADVEAALQAHHFRHDYPEQCLQESIADGERLIVVRGERVGQLNGLTQIDLGDYRFGFPARVTARTFAGEEGLLNIEREVEMSGPIHDKGVLILYSYLAALFAHLAPLALDAAVVFEQEYSGLEGDSASCAELYVLLSSLSGLPLKQGIAVTGALNQHGDILPVGGINEKIEGYFRACTTLGLDGSQGVLIPQRNRRHLMLAQPVIDAVAQGRFHIYTADHVSEALELLTGQPSGMQDSIGNVTADYAADTVLGRAQATLRAYRQACQAVDERPPKRVARKPLR
jgi:predicted ATP-dependent protease